MRFAAPQPVAHQARVAPDPGGAVHLPVLRRRARPRRERAVPRRARRHPPADDGPPRARHLPVRCITAACAPSESTSSPVPPRLRVDEVPDPSVGAGQVLIEVRAAGVNFPDVLLSRGHVPVQADAAVLARRRVRRRSCARSAPASPPSRSAIASPRRCVNGAYVEKICLPEATVVKLPDAVGFEVGAATLLTYATTYHALVDRAAIAAGEKLLVLGAAGGVGIAACELGALLGARVIAAASSDDKLAFCREHGATDVINYATRGPQGSAQGADLGQRRRRGLRSGRRAARRGRAARHGVAGPLPRGRLRLGRDPEDPAQPGAAQGLPDRRRVLGLVRDARSGAQPRARRRRSSSGSPRASCARRSTRCCRSTAPARRSSGSSSARSRASWCSCRRSPRDLRRCSTSGEAAVVVSDLFTSGLPTSRSDRARRSRVAATPQSP